jgi:hypothetical protein
VEVSAKTLSKVPGENLRVSRTDIGALWALAEHRGSQPARGDQYLIGVLWTCRWLASQPVWSRMISRWEMPAAPFTRHRHAAMPETIETEYMAALTARPFERERARGVAATLAWTWYGSRRPPLDVTAAAAG